LNNFLNGLMTIWLSPAGLPLFQIEGCAWVEIKGEEEIEAMRAKEGFIEAFQIVRTQRFFSIVGGGENKCYPEEIS
jgi:hypothetical protein